MEKTPPPAEWRKTLDDSVGFFQELTEIDKHSFLKRCQFFLHSVKIIGVRTDIDETTRVMIAASAIIPVFQFPQFIYTNLEEILVYPSAFNVQFKSQERKRQQVWLGKVF